MAVMTLESVTGRETTWTLEKVMAAPLDGHYK